MNVATHNVVPMPARSLEDFVDRVFRGAYVPAWIVHLETGQIVWASAAARAKIAASRADAAGGSALTAVPGDQPRVDEQRANEPTAGPVPPDSHTLWSAHHELGEIRRQRFTLVGLAYELVVVHVPPADARARMSSDPTVSERTTPQYWSSRYDLPERLAEVAALLAQGHTATTIAEVLQVTRQSAGTYVKRVLRRLPESQRMMLRQRMRSSNIEA